MWNKLPNSAQSAASLPTLKKTVKDGTQPFMYLKKKKRKPFFLPGLAPTSYDFFFALNIFPQLT